MSIALFPSYDTASADIPHPVDGSPEQQDYIADAEKVLDEYDHSLHQATGSRVQHTDSFGMQTNGRPDKQQTNPEAVSNGGGTSGSGSKGDGKGGHGNKQKEKHKRGGGPNYAHLGNAKLAGPKGVGGVGKLAPTVTSGTPSSGSGSPVMLIVILGAVAIGGYLLWHRLHKASHEEKQINREESHNENGE